MLIRRAPKLRPVMFLYAHRMRMALVFVLSAMGVLWWSAPQWGVSMSGVALACAWMALTSLAGTAFLIVHVYPMWTVHECVFGGVPLGMTVGAWASFLFAASVHMVDWKSVCFAMLLSAAYLVLEASPLRARLGDPAVRRRALWEVMHMEKLYGLLAVAAPYLAYELARHMLMGQGAHYYTAGSCYGDLAIHLDIVASFAHGCNKRLALLDVQTPIFAGAPLVYPYMPDFQSALFVVGGTSVSFALLAPSLLMCLCLLAWLYLLAYRLVLEPAQAAGESPRGDDEKARKVAARERAARAHWTALLATVVLVLSGGVGWATYVAAKDFGLAKITDGGSHVMEFTEGNKRPLFWFGFIPHVLLPQRTTQFSYTLSLMACVALFISMGVRPRHTHAKRRMLLLAGLLTALLPLLQAHSFLGVVCIAVACACWELPHMWKRATFVSWLHYAAPVALLGLPQCLVYTQKAGEDGFLTYGWLWARHRDTPHHFWFSALGPFVFLSLAGLLLLAPHARRFLAGFFGVFALGNYVVFQPWDKDNIKLLYIWAFGAAAAVARAMLWVRRRSTTLFLALLLLGSLSGVFALMRESQSSVWFCTQDDEQFGAWVAANTDPDAIFLTDEEHIHPIENFAGRSTVCGHHRWLDSYGIKYKERAAMVKRAYRTLELAPLLEHGVEYVYVGIRRGYTGGQSTLGRQAAEAVGESFELVYEDRERKLYRLRAEHREHLQRPRAA